MGETSMEPGTIKKVRVERLRLDRENPRLNDRPEETTDEAIIARLFRSAELDELLDSISRNGYLDIEPLVAMPDAEGEKLVVLEGNRRLAALRLFRERELRDKIQKSEDLIIRVPSVDDGLENTFKKVSVYYVASREAARSFIGFKHINGPAKWDAYAKARFAAAWYKQSGCRDLESIAKAIGDKHATVKRMVSAIYVLDQAKEKNLFDVEDRFTPKFSFSHLYTALGRSQYMQYLELAASWARYDPKPYPVPEGKLDNLKQLLVWIYGSKESDVPPVVKAQNPDIKRLAEVLAEAESLNVLKATSDLDKAYIVTEPVSRRFSDSLIRARYAIKDSAGSLRAYDGRDASLLDIAEDVKETAETVYQRMQKKNREAISAE